MYSTLCMYVHYISNVCSTTSKKYRTLATPAPNNAQENKYKSIYINILIYIKYYYSKIHVYIIIEDVHSLDVMHS